MPRLRIGFDGGRPTKEQDGRYAGGLGMVKFVRENSEKEAGVALPAVSPRVPRPLERISTGLKMDATLHTMLIKRVPAGVFLPFPYVFDFFAAPLIIVPPFVLCIC
jgi:hypothetical protein